MNKLFLQRFGDVTPINVTTQSSLSPTMKTFYDTSLLKNARAKAVFNQFGMKQRMKGNKVEWRKFNTFALALTPLVEGVIPSGQSFGMTNIEAETTQHGTYTAVSDRLELESYDDVIFGASEEMGASMGETQEILTRNIIAMGNSVRYAPIINGSTETEVTSRRYVGRANILTPKLVNKVYTWLKKNKVDTEDGGYYIWFVHPSQVFDLRQSEEWIEAHKYADVTPMFNGEIGTYHKFRFVESTNVTVLRGEDLASDSRTLLVNNASGISAGSVTTIAFDGGTVAADALKGRKLFVTDVNGKTYQFKVTGNTTSSITVEAQATTGAIADNTVIYPGEGGKDGDAVYLSLAFGKNAYGVLDPEGEGAEMIIKTKGQIGGPLEQFSTIGYKFCHGAKILYQERMCRVETGSSLCDEDEAN